jgi:hypothetical protein
VIILLGQSYCIWYVVLTFENFSPFRVKYVWTFSKTVGVQPWQFPKFYFQYVPYWQTVIQVCIDSSHRIQSISSRTPVFPHRILTKAGAVLLNQTEVISCLLTDCNPGMYTTDLLLFWTVCIYWFQKIIISEKNLLGFMR